MNMKSPIKNQDYAKLEHQTNSDTVVTKCDNNVINIMKVDMRRFDFSTYFYLMNANAISTSNEKMTKQLFKKAMHNFYARFKLFARLHSRAFILNPIFLYEMKVHQLYVVDIVSTTNYFLRLAGFDIANFEERELLRDNYSSVSNALVNGMVENCYPVWLQHLFNYYEKEHALMQVPCKVERQMFSTTLTPSPEMEDMLDELKQTASLLPDKMERDKWFEQVKKVSDKITLPSSNQWQSIVENSGNISHAFDAVIDSAPNVKQGASSLRVLADQFIRLEHDSKKALRMADSFSSIAKDVAICSLIAWTVYRYDSDRTPTSLAMVAIAGVAGIYMCDSAEAKVFLVASGALVVYRSFTSGDRGELIERQSGLLGFASVASSFLVFMKSVKWGTLPRRILDLIRVTKELPEFIMQIFELLKGFANSVWLTFYKTPLFTSKGDFNEGYVENITHIFKLYANDSLEYTFDEAQMVDMLLEQTRHYLNNAKKFGDRKLLDSNFKVLKDIQRDLSDLRYSKGGSRQEPVVIMLEGVPGTKKTVWQRNFAVALVKMFKKHVEDQSREIYVKPAGDYWSMYKNQFVCCFDDFGQVRDSLGDPREKGDLINMYNTAPFPLNMNENEDKGKTFFTSEFIVMTANEGWDTSPSIISEEALKRRVDLHLSVVRNVNSQPINSTGIEVLIPEHYSFNVKLPGGVLLSNQTFQQVLDLAASKYKIKQKHYQVFQKVQKEIIGDVIMSSDVEQNLTKKLDEVESKIQETISKYNQFGETVEKQSQDVLAQGDVQMEFIDTFDEMLSEKLKIHADMREIDTKVPMVKTRLPPLREGKKTYDGYSFDCQYYDDLADLEYEAAYLQITQYTNISEPRKNLIPVQDLKFLELHYGVNRTRLFLIEMQWATDMFGLVKDDPLKQYVQKISREERGYYMTVCSLLMCIWLQDRRSFFYCHIDPAFCLKELVQMRGFREVVLLSDWKIALKRTFGKTRTFLSEGIQPLVKVVQNIEESLSEKVVSFLGIKSFTQQDVKSFMRYSAGILTLVTVASPLLSLLTNYFTGGKSSQEQSSQPFYKSEKSAPKGSLKDAIKAASVTKQSATMIPIVNKLENASAVISISMNGTTYSLGKVFFLDTNMFLIPLHFYQDILELDEYEIILDDSDIKVSLKKEDMLRDVAVVETQHLEFAIVRSDKLKKTRKNMLENFVTRDYISKFPGEFSIAIRPFTEKTTIMSSAHIGSFTYAGKTVDKMVKYQVNTGKGDCGSMIYAMIPTLGSSIICGIHDAGTPKGCFNTTASAYIITREDIAEACEQLGVDDISVEVQGNTYQLPHSHSPYGVSRIVPSPLFSIARENTQYPTKFPARLLPDKETGIDPLKVGLSKYKAYPMNYCEATLDRATSDLIDEWLEKPHRIHYGSRVPSDLAFYGDPMCEYMKAIPTSTSSGYPFKFTDRDIKKRLKDEGPSGPTFREMSSRLNQAIIALRSGHRPEFIYTLNLKDETRPLAKVESYSTRIFMGTPFDLYWLKKIYFGEFMLFMQMDCVEKGTAMAVNPHSDDWKKIMRRLSELVPAYDYAICQDFDYAHFDGSNNKEVMLQVCHVINSWYSHHGIGQDNDIRELLFREVYEFKYIEGTCVTTMETSLPSGSYLTLLINSITNRLLVRYAFYRKFPLGRFLSSVRDVVLGDDNVVSVSLDTSKVWSPVDIANSVAELGFEITLGDKTVVTNSWSSLDTVTFLKRRFTIDALGIVRAPLDKDTMWNTICYSKKGILYKQIFADNIQFFYREMSQHGKLVYADQIGKLRKLLQQVPECNHYPMGIPKEWMYLDKLVRHSPFFAPSDM